MVKEIVENKMMKIENSLNEVKAKDKGVGFQDLKFIIKPEDSPAILNNEQKSILYSAISELGIRRTQLLEGLDATLNELRNNQKGKTN